MSETWRNIEGEMIGNIFCATNGAATHDMPQSSEEMMKAMRAAKIKFEALRRETLRSASNLENCKCPKCGRSPTITNDGMGDAIEMCCTIYRRLLADPQFNPDDFWPRSPLGFRLDHYECDERPTL